jgi:hypothetical protein
MRYGTAFFAVISLFSCAPPPCASSVACGRGQVCGLDGRCGPLAVGEARFATSQWFSARDWGTSGRERRPLNDALAIGGRGQTEGLLAFGPLPGASRILRALLVLQPGEPDERIESGAEIVVEHVEPFVGGALPPRPHPGPLSFAAAHSALLAGAPRATRIDITRAARTAAARRDRSLYLLLRVEGEGSALFASPWALADNARPRLELLIH